MTGTTIDKEALKAKYREERDKRLRPDGNEQYIRITGQVGALPRGPVHAGRRRASRCHDDVTVAFIGGGFAGLVTGARLVEQGDRPTCGSSRRAATSAAPGTGTGIPARSATRRRSSTCRCSRRPGTCRRRSTCTRRRSSSTASGSASSTASTTTRCSTPRSPTSSGTTPRSRWIVRTNRGDEFTARFLVDGHRPAARPEAAGHPGHRVVPRPLVPHQPVGLRRTPAATRTARRWTSSPTSGSAIIGTGATSVQCVPHLARAAKELYVFQRTPSSVDVRANRPTDPEWFAEIATPGWQQRWLENFTANQTGHAGRRGPRPGRLDRHLAPHPLEDHGAPAGRSSRRRR